MFVYAHLSDDKLTDLQRFEQAKGIRVLAMQPVSVEPASLTADELAELRQLEEQLGLCLLAVH